MRESEYQAKLIKKLRRMFKGCIILKNDAAYLQGVPDLLILYRDRWAALEVKASMYAPMQNNQDYYINEMADMSFASIIYPENEKEVLDDLSLTFGAHRSARLS